MTVFPLALRRTWSRPLIAGACGGLACVASAWLFLLPVRQHEAELAALDRKIASVAKADAPVAPGGERAASFAAQLPASDTLTEWLERIDAASAATGVRVERTDYRVANDAPARLARYQIALPVQGTYPQVRAFVSALLASVPTLAVSAIDIKRDAIGSGTVEARLKVSVYLRGVAQ